MKKIYQTPSVIALLFANIIPIIGVLFWNYDLGMLLLVYWAESGIIGLYTLIKMIIIATKEGIGGLSILFMAPFFIVHFGGFMAGHLVFILAIIGSGFMPGPVDQPLSQIFYENTTTIHWALLALVLSHGVSFAQNFVIKKEHEKLQSGDLIAAPYGRIIVMHITIIIGAFATIALGNNVGFLILFVFLKIFIDAGAHIKEHKKLGSI